MKKLNTVIFLICSLCVGMVFAQKPVMSDFSYTAGVIYFSPPFSAQDYKKCIFGTKENMQLSDDQQVGCEDRYNPDSENLNRFIDLKLAKKIVQSWGNHDFFKNPSAYIYQLDEINKKRAIYLWSNGPNWMTPVDDDRYQFHPFSIHLSTVNNATGNIQSLPVILYKKNKSKKSSVVEYVYDFDLVRAKEDSLILNIYQYKNNKRSLLAKYMINQSGELIKM